MKENFAETLESYLIPAEEGLFSKIKEKFSKNRKPSNVGISPNISTYSGKASAIDQNILATRVIEEEIRNEYPELVEKEMRNRFLCLKKIKAAVLAFDKKYKIAGFGIYKDAMDELDDIIRSGKLQPDDSREYTDGLNGFAEQLLPSIREEDLRNAKKYDYYKFNYGWNSGWALSVYSGDQWDWWDSLPKDKKVDIRGHDYDYTLDLWSQFRERIEERLMKELSNIEFVFGVNDGGDNDGSIIDIIFKPSDELLKIAKQKGYKWFE